MEAISPEPAFSWPDADITDSEKPFYGSLPSVSALLSLQKRLLSGLCLGGQGPGIWTFEAGERAAWGMTRFTWG